MPELVEVVAGRLYEQVLSLEVVTLPMQSIAAKLGFTSFNR